MTSNHSYQEEIVSSWIQKMWNTWCSLGYSPNDLSNSHDNHFRQIKHTSCCVNGIVLLYCILCLAILDNSVVSFALYGLGIVGATCVQIDYIINKRSTLILIFFISGIVVYGPVVVMDAHYYRGAVQSFAQYHGLWYVPQALGSTWIPKMGGLNKYGYVTLLASVITFIVSLVVDCFNGLNAKDFTYSVVTMFLLLTAHGIATLIPSSQNAILRVNRTSDDEDISSCHSKQAPTISVTPPPSPTPNFDPDELPISISIHSDTSKTGEDRRRDTLGSIPDSSINKPLIRVFTTDPSITKGTPEGTPFHIAIPSPRLSPLNIDRPQSSSLALSISLLSPRKKTTLMFPPVSPVEERIKCVLVMIEGRVTGESQMMIEKFVKSVHRCAHAYHGVVVWNTGLEITLRFPEDKVQSAIKFCHNVNSLCFGGRSQSGSASIPPTNDRGTLSTASSITLGEITTISFSMQAGYANTTAYQTSNTVSRLRAINQMLRQQTGNMSVGCDSTITPHLSGAKLMGSSEGVECYVLEEVGETSTYSVTSAEGMNQSTIRDSSVLSSSIATHPANVGSIHVGAALLHRHDSSLHKSATQRRGSAFSLNTLRGKRHSGVDVLHVPSNFPMDLLELWLKYDTNRNGWLSAQDTWNFLTRIGIKMTQERFFYFLEEFDTDGLCTISMQEFADAYFTSLSGLVLMSRIRSFGEFLIAQGIDPNEALMGVWIEMISRKAVFANSEVLCSILEKFGVPASQPFVSRMIVELGRDDDKAHVNDLLGLFLPELSAQDQELIERKESVSRVDVLCGMQATFETQTQMAERTAHDWAVRYDHWVSIVMLPYILYSVLESTYASGLWFHPDMYESMRARSIVASVISAIPLLWVVAKLWVPREVNGRYLVNLSDIRSHYVGSLEMVVDIVGVIPLEVFATSYGISQEYDPLFRLHKIVLLYHFNTFYRRIASSWNASLSRIIQTFVWWGLCIHCFACVFLSLCPSEVSSDIITVENFTLKHAAFMYSQAFNWAIMLMVGLNRGASIPSSDAFLLLSLATVLVGVVALAVIVTMISNALNVRDSSALFADKIEETMMFFEEVGVDLATTDEVIQYYRHMYQTFGTTDPLSSPMQDELPPELEIKLRLAKTVLWFEHVSVMQPLLQQAITTYEVNRIVIPLVMLPGEYVSRKGHAIFSLYVVSHGTLHLHHKNTIHVLHRGAGVNEYGLLHNVHALHDVRVPPNQYANLFEVSKVGLTAVLTAFPEFAAAMYLEITRLMNRLKRKGLIEADPDNTIFEDNKHMEEFFRLHEAKETAMNLHLALCEKLKMS